MEFSKGTVFRIFVNSGNQPEIDAKVDIAQQELNNDCYMTIENWCLKPKILWPFDAPSIPPVAGSKTAILQNFWAQAKYIQLESVQIPPYIDFSSQNILPGARPQTGETITSEQVEQNTRNTTVFARLPLISSPSPGDAQLTTQTTFAGDRVLNKDSILYDMRNNPNALGNGRLRIRLLDETGEPLVVERFPGLITVTAGNPAVDSLIDSFAFTLVIYKCSERYN